MTSALLKDYMEENLTTDRVLLLTNRSRSSVDVSDSFLFFHIFISYCSSYNNNIRLQLNICYSNLHNWNRILVSSTTLPLLLLSIIQTTNFWSCGYSNFRDSSVPSWHTTLKWRCTYVGTTSQQRCSNIVCQLGSVNILFVNLFFFNSIFNKLSYFSQTTQKLKNTGIISQERLKPLNSTLKLMDSPCGSSSSSRKRKLHDQVDSPKAKNDESNNSGNSETPSSLKSISTDLAAKLPQKMFTSIPLWENQELLCWLDSVLSLIVLNETIMQYEHKEGTLKRLLTEYDYALDVFGRTKRYADVKESLGEMRTSALKFLHLKMLSSFTEEDSPLLSAQFLLKTCTSLYDELEWHYSTKFKCSQCKFEKKDG